MNEAWEALKGFTDIPIAAAAVVIGCLTIKNNRSRDYTVFFFSIAAGAILGAIAHIFSLPQWLWEIVWAGILLAMFESTVRFVIAFTPYLCRDRRFNEKLFRIAEVIMYAASLAVLVAFGRKELYLFLAFAAGCLSFLVSCIIRARKIPAKAVAIIASLPILILLQTFSNVMPYAVAAEHAILTVILFAVYSVSGECAAQSVENNTPVRNDL